MACATYFGKVCAKHPELKGERYKSSYTCLICVRGRARERRRENPAHALAAGRAWAAENPEKRQAICRRYYTKNRGKALASSQAWGAKNKEKRRGYERKWRAANPAAVLAYNARRRARKLSATPPLTAIDRARVQEFYDIAAARYAQTGERWQVDHDVPLARGGKHHPDNLLLLPAEMNSLKGARFNTTMDFLLS